MPARSQLPSPSPLIASALARQKNLQLFTIFNVYRLLLSLFLAGSFLLDLPGTALGAQDAPLFQRLVLLYAALNLLAAGLGLSPLRQVLALPSTVIGIVILDILLLTLISYSCGGVNSGMSQLLVVPIAAGSILQPLRMSLFFAAAGSLAMICSEVYLYLNFAQRSGYLQAGLLSLLLFATALAMHILGGRLRQNELINEQQAVRIQALQEMNVQVMQRMRTGILVVDSAGRLLHANSAARKLLLLDSQTEQPALPAILLHLLEVWRGDPDSRPAPFRLSRSDPQVLATFAWLDPTRASPVLVFLEDYALLTSRLQQLKLVSLGRLTASIAHEIRNPLGAISHAGQLLSESTALNREDRRFADIILQHCQRVNEIIENILQLSRSRGDVPQVISLKPWLVQFIERFAASRGKTLDIELEVLPEDLRIRAFPGQLEQLLTNLCDNGLRYSERHAGRPHILIQAGLVEHNDMRFIDVIDDGPGLAREDEDQVFEPFFTTESSGTGLGLYISREICEANQAQLLFRRSAGDKSCFRVLFGHPDRQIV